MDRNMSPRNLQTVSVNRCCGTRDNRARWVGVARRSSQHPPQASHQPPHLVPIGGFGEAPQSRLHYAPTRPHLVQGYMPYLSMLVQ
ncbi:hypothetical protein Pcinc_033715 [Petrolisthes cinctipes]|uniref:Uncharacterized protein n=1 Tax=Petrolisthes cinctipes TaxID=88211 RepID=A0AAE1ERQ7_PETCI|nr:hypothetical protein Pcinc_033715 [Petrolisthes cinctipes]